MNVPLREVLRLCWSLPYPHVYDYDDHDDDDDERDTEQDRHEAIAQEASVHAHLF